MSNQNLDQESICSSRIELGQILKKEREKLGLSYEEIAAIIRIRIILLKALEAGDYSSFSSVTYIKGFIKSYAQFLKIPFEPLLELYEKEPHEKIPFAHLGLTEIPKSKKGPSKKIIIASGLCFAIIAFININWKNVKSFIEEHYDIPAHLTQNLPKDIKPHEENIFVTIHEEPIVITNQSTPSITPLIPFGDEKIFLVEIPKTNNPILKPDKTTLIPNQNTWIELYNGEELLLRTELKSNQNYLMPKNEATTLLIKNNNNIRILKPEKEMNLEQSLNCNDFYCNLIESID